MNTLIFTKDSQRRSLRRQYPRGAHVKGSLTVVTAVAVLMALQVLSSGQSFPIATNPVVPELSGGVAFDGVTYLFGYVSGTNLVGVRVSTNGQLIGSPVIVGTNVGWPPRAALASARTNCLVVWSDFSKTSGVTMFGRICEPTSGTVYPAFPLLPSPGTNGFQVVLDAASDGTNYLVIWCDTKDGVFDDGELDYVTRVYGQFVTGAGTLSGSKFVVAEGLKIRELALAFGRTNYLMAFQAGDNDHRTLCRTIGLNGALGPLTETSSTLSWDSNPLGIGFDGTNYLVLWNCSTNYNGPGELMLFGRIVSPSGTPLGSELVIDTNRCGFPAVGFDGKNYLVLWSVNVDSPNPSIKAGFLNSSGNPVGPVLSPLPVVGTNSPFWAYRGLMFDGRRFVLSATFGKFISDESGGIIEFVGDVYGAFFPRSTTPPYFTNVTIANGFFQGQLYVVPGLYYTIEISTNLNSQAWLPVDIVSSTQTNLLTLGDDEPPTGNLFVRAVLGVKTQPRFALSFLEFAYGGNFGSSYTPTPSYPVNLSSYSAWFQVSKDFEYPPYESVFFTGPPGSGLQNTPAGQSFGGESWRGYQSPFVYSPAAAPGGTWIVSYKGSNVTFNIPDPQASSRFVLPLPTVSVVGGVLQSVSWVYKNPSTGATLSGPPPYMTKVYLQIEGTSGRLYNSHEIPPTTAFHSLSTSVPWADVVNLTMSYDDDLGNKYIIFYQK